MRRRRLAPGACALMYTAATLAAAPAAPSVLANVMPAPAEVSPGRGSFSLNAGTVVMLPRESAAAEVALYFVGLLRERHPAWLDVRAALAGARPAIEFALVPDTPADSPEAYELSIEPQHVRVRAHDARGLFYGAVTLWQLCIERPDGNSVLRLPALHISDTPRFRWRGLMLDSARHFQSVEFIMRYLDWMALHKLNVLGWHLSDDQGWRLEIKKYPRLTQVGAWRVEAGRAAARDLDPATGRARLYGGFYTQEDVRRIVAHAAARHVTIVPEIDMPGHASAAIVAYPQLGVTDHPPTAVPADWGIYTNLFNVEEATFAFLEDVLGEVITLFPGPYVHVGGDEAVKDQWRASTRIHERMRELRVPNEAALQGYFTHRLGEFLSAHGRRLIGWDEILEGGIPADATVMSWRGTQGAIAAAAAGHDAVLSPDPVLYLDYRQGPSPDEPPGRGRVQRLEDVYRFNPLPGPLAAQAQHVLGVQANLWTEHVRTEARAAYMTWPRAAALAEVGWSPPARIDWSDFARRLPAEFARLRSLGVHYSEDVLAPPRRLAPDERHMSQDLRTCTDKVVLNLEDDAPRAGERAVFLIDIENPCWVFAQADLSHPARLTAAVGQVPFNFQIGKDIEAIKLDAPRSAAGELEVRLDGCDSEPVALLSLAGASDNDAVTVLPAVALPVVAGRHDLCLKFTQRSLDPMWALDWLQISP